MNRIALLNALARKVNLAMLIFGHLPAIFPNQRSACTVDYTLILVALLSISRNTENMFDVSTFSVHRKQQAEK